MIKNYFPEVIGVLLIAALGTLAVERPGIDLNLRPSVADQRQPSEAKKEEANKVDKEIIRGAVGFKALKDRNIFSADGKYSIVIPGAGAAGTGGPLPENPYTLIGILHGEEKKAVFRDHTGSIIALTVGKKLIDDSVITRIDSTSVEVTKGKEKRELKIFSVKVPRLSTGKKP